MPIILFFQLPTSYILFVQPSGIVAAPNFAQMEIDHCFS
jgi:hypothetical protein